MTALGRTAALGAVLALGLAAGDVAAQSQDPSAPGQAVEGPTLPSDEASQATGQGIVASANGVPITSTDVAYMSQQLMGPRPADQQTSTKTTSFQDNYSEARLQ